MKTLNFSSIDLTVHTVLGSITTVCTTWGNPAHVHALWTTARPFILSSRLFFSVHSEKILKLATNIARQKLVSVGTCFGKFTKTSKFRLHITALDFLAPYAKVTFSFFEIALFCFLLTAGVWLRGSVALVMLFILFSGKCSLYHCQDKFYFWPWSFVIGVVNNRPDVAMIFIFKIIQVMSNIHTCIK